MLRRVEVAGQGRTRSGLAGSARSRRDPGLCAAVLLSCWVATSSSHAAEPFPPGEASEHFDAQARTGKKDILLTLQADGRFQTVSRAFEVAGLAPLLRMRGPLTVFLPTDAAFDKLPAGRLEQWMKQPKLLKAVLRYHMLRAYVPSKQLTRLRNALTAAGALVTIDGNSGIKVNGASVISTDLYASNGVIHVLDSVLVPPEPKASSKKKQAGKGSAATDGGAAEDGDTKPEVRP